MLTSNGCTLANANRMICVFGISVYLGLGNGNVSQNRAFQTASIATIVFVTEQNWHHRMWHMLDRKKKFVGFSVTFFSPAINSKLKRNKKLVTLSIVGILTYEVWRNVF